MKENEALDMMKEKLKRIELDDLACIEKGCDRQCDNCDLNYEQGNHGQQKEAMAVAISALEEIQQYRAIGTVEECREAMERQRAKEVNNRTLLRDLNGSPYSIRGDCPDCGSVNLVSTNTDYCNVCGQKLDWSDTD